MQWHNNSIWYIHVLKPVCDFVPVKYIFDLTPTGEHPDLIFFLYYFLHGIHPYLFLSKNGINKVSQGNLRYLYLKFSVLFMLHIKFCTIKTGSKTKREGEEVCNLFSETALAPPHSLLGTAARTVGGSSSLLLVQLLLAS